MRKQPGLPQAAAMAISKEEREQEILQTGRFLLGMIIASYLTGVFTTIFGLKQR